MCKRLITGLTILSLIFFPACSAIDNAINKMTAKMDQIKAELKTEARQAMDRLEITMQQAMTTFIEKGKEAAGEKINEVVTLLVALSGQVKGQLQDVIGGAIAKGLAGDQGLLTKIKDMAAENPEALKALGDQFVGAIVDSTQRKLSESGAGSSLMAGISSSISSSIQDAVGNTANQVIGALNQQGGSLGGSGGGSFTLDQGSAANVGGGGAPTEGTFGDTGGGGTSPGGSTVQINRASPTGGNSLDDDFFTRRVTMDDGAPGAGHGFVVSPDNPQVLILRRR